jgi:hypothetical protein
MTRRCPKNDTQGERKAHKQMGSKFSGKADEERKAEADHADLFHESHKALCKSLQFERKEV